jgi:hypothetical protein
MNQRHGPFHQQTAAFRADRCTGGNRSVTPACQCALGWQIAAAACKLNHKGLNGIASGLALQDKIKLKLIWICGKDNIAETKHMYFHGKTRLRLLEMKPLLYPEIPTHSAMGLGNINIPSGNLLFFRVVL